MVIHSRGVCCGTSYFAPRVLGPSIALTIDFNVGDAPAPMGCAFLPPWWGAHQKDSSIWRIFKIQSRWHDTSLNGREEMLIFFHKVEEQPHVFTTPRVVDKLKASK